MNPTSRLHLVRSLLPIAALLLALPACDDGRGGVPDGAGSETHFLSGCSQSCAQGFDCICGVCTQICQDDTQCSALGAECYSSVALAVGNACSQPPQTPVSVCHAECDTDADCTNLSSKHTCQGGFCTQPTATPPADATDDTSVPGDTAVTDTSDTMTPPDTTNPVCQVTPSACDGIDNDCDGDIDETTVDFTLPDAPLLALATEPDWSLTVLDGKVYTVVVNGQNLIVNDHAEGRTVAQIAGHSPRLFPSEQAQGVVLFYVGQADNELGQPQDEVHAVSIDPQGTAGTPVCLGCADPTRSQRGDVLDYDVAFDGVDTDQDGRIDFDDASCTDDCGYVATYVRSDLKLYSARTHHDTLAVVESSEGLVLALDERNANVYAVDLELIHPGRAALAVFRNDHSEDELVLTRALVDNRIQAGTPIVAATGGQMRDERVSMRVLEDNRVVIARIVDAGVEVTVRRENAGPSGFDLINGPELVSLQTPHTPAAVRLAGLPGEGELLLMIELFDDATGEYIIEVHFLDMDFDQLDIEAGPPPRPGRSPRGWLERDTFLVGLLGSPMGNLEPVTDSMPTTTPLMLEPICDGPGF